MAATQGARSPSIGRLPPFGIAVWPFVGAVVLVLLVAAGTRQEITTTWVFAAIAVGVVVAAATVAMTIARDDAAGRARHPPPSAGVRHGSHGQSGPPGGLGPADGPSVAAPRAGDTSPSSDGTPGAGASRAPPSVSTSGASPARTPGPVATSESAASKPEPSPASESGSRKKRRKRESDGKPTDPLANIHAVETQGRRHRRNCVNCGTPVPLRQDTCPSCAHKQVFTCKGCQTQIRLDWTNCPECGRSVA